MTYDGSINFDTHVDTKGFNDGTKKISAGLKNVNSGASNLSKAMASLGNGGAMAMKVIATAIKVVAVAIGAALAAVIAISLLLIGAIVGVVAASIREFFKLEGTAKDIKLAFENLKLAFATAFSSLVAAATPAILTVINWLTRLINIVAQVVAALMGQTQYMVATANASQSAAAGSAALAKNTKEAGKAAKGALAAFDSLNVLQMNQADQTASGGGGGGGGVSYKMVDIDPKVTNFVEKVKKFFKEDLPNFFAGVWKWIVLTWNNIGLFFDGIFNSVKLWAVNTWNSIVSIWGTVSAWFKTNVIDPLVAFWSPVFDWLGIVAYDAVLVIKYVWGLVASWFKEKVIDPIVESFNLAWPIISWLANRSWQAIVSIWQTVSSWFSTYVTAPIMKGFDIALTWIGDKFSTIFSGIKNFVKGIINDIIKMINGMLSGAVGGLNGLVNAANTAGGKLPGWKTIPTITAPQIPYLAKGAVIPPNAAFAAVLGDQRSGTNIEAPADLIRQIVREEIGGQENKNINITFGGTMGELVRLLKPEIDKENRRVGASLITWAGA